jgi:D-3-phosphoglycerate dehydrogenase
MSVVFQVDADATLEPFASERTALASIGAKLVLGNCKTPGELIERAGDAQVLWLAWQPRIDRAVLEALPRAELVIRWGVGYDQIDVTAATELGVAIANAPTYGTIDVAEHVLALLLAGARNLAWAHEAMRRGEWPGAVRGTHRLQGRTLGLLGFGRIGSAVAQRARGFGLEVISYDPVVSASAMAEHGVRAVNLDELLAQSDYLSLHVPLNEHTLHFMNSDRLAQLKRGAALINASRGKVIDTQALLAALADGPLGWAALDVYEDEPLPPDSLLRSVGNLVLTPHAAGFSEEAWDDLRAEMMLTTTQWLTTGWADRIVNPEVRARPRVVR